MEEQLVLSVNIVYTTIENKTQASLIVRELIDADLVLCSNIIDNVNSIFKWEEEIKNENECIVIMKCLSCSHNWKRQKLTEYVSFLSRCPKCGSKALLRNDFSLKIFQFFKKILKQEKK